MALAARARVRATLHQYAPPAIGGGIEEDADVRTAGYGILRPVNQCQIRVERERLRSLQPRVVVFEREDVSRPAALETSSRSNTTTRGCKDLRRSRSTRIWHWFTGLSIPYPAVRTSASSSIPPPIAGGAY